MFKLVDRDASGSITKSEFAALFRTLNLQVTPIDLDAMIVDMDKNDDGEIQLNEFIACMSTRVATKYTADQVKAAFAAFSTPWDRKYGRIDLSIIEKALSQPNMRNDGESLTEFEERRRSAIELIDQLQVDYMGKFHYEAYVSQVMK
jgi:Ca2+-binding EF-hand superfamily protein